MAWGEELPSLLPGGLGELPQQVLIGCPQHVSLDMVGVEADGMEGVEKGGERLLRQTVLVGPVDVAEDADELGIGLFDLLQRSVQGDTDVHDGGVHVVPGAARGYG